MIEYLDSTAARYQPGVCNIGSAEIRRRRQVGYLGLAGAVGLGASLIALRAPAWTRLIVAVPVATGLSGIIQAQLRFCVGFGMAGLRNMGELGAQERVEDAEARTVDRRKAMRINAASMAGGLAVAFLFAVLPGRRAG